MKAPEPQSAVNQLRALAHRAEEAVNELLQHSELHPRPSGGVDYHEWHATNPAAGIARSKALGLFHAFEDDLRLILSWHDPTYDQVHQMESHSVYEIINQRAHTQLASLDEAREKISAYFSGCLQSLTDLYDRLEGKNLVIPDTNVLIAFPKLENYQFGLPNAIVVITPIVVRELENHKRRMPKKNNEGDKARWDHAREVIRRLNDCGDAGDILEGVAISHEVSVMVQAIEPRRESAPVDSGNSIAFPEAYPPIRKRTGLPGWLDLNVPDDRFIASALEVCREHPKARIVVTSGDLNVLTKSRQARLSALNAERFFEKD